MGRLRKGRGRRGDGAFYGISFLIGGLFLGEGVSEVLALMLEEDVGEASQFIMGEALEWHHDAVSCDVECAEDDGVEGGDVLDDVVFPGTVFEIDSVEDEEGVGGVGADDIVDDRVVGDLCHYERVGDVVVPGGVVSGLDGADVVREDGFPVDYLLEERLGDVEGVLDVVVAEPVGVERDGLRAAGVLDDEDASCPVTGGAEGLEVIVLCEAWESRVFIGREESVDGDGLSGPSGAECRGDGCDAIYGDVLHGTVFLFLVVEVGEGLPDGVVYILAGVCRLDEDVVRDHVTAGFVFGRGTLVVPPGTAVTEIGVERVHCCFLWV